MAQGRQVDGDHVEPVEQVFAEATFADHLAQIDIGGGDDAHVHLQFLGAAEMHELAILEHAQNLALGVEAHGADFVQEQRAPVGDLEQPFFGGNSACERTLDVPEQIRFEQVCRHGTGVDRHEGSVASRRMQMDRLGDQFFARSALALQQNGRAAGRDLGDEVEYFQHGLALAYDVFEVVALLKSALELNVLFFGSLAGDRRAHVGEQLFVVPWFLDEVGGAALHGPHRVLDRAVGGDHNHRLERIKQVDLGQHVHAVFVR